MTPRRGRATNQNQGVGATPDGELASLPHVLTVVEAARILRISPASVYRGVRDGTVPALRINRRVLIPRDAIASLLHRAAQHREKGR